MNAKQAMGEAGDGVARRAGHLEMRRVFRAGDEHRLDRAIGLAFGGMKLLDRAERIVLALQ